MTSRAGQARDMISDCSTAIHRDIRERAQQEVRDDIRARLGPVETALRLLDSMVQSRERHSGDSEHAVMAAFGVLAVISSSSAETCSFEACDLPPGHPGDHAFTPHIPGFPSSATETQDGERPHRPVDQPVKSRWPHRPHDPICEECGHAWRAPCHDWITAEYAPTPDDRDREVERVGLPVREASFKVLADHFLALLNEGANLIERGNRYIEAEDGPDGFVVAYRWPKVGSWHRILHWYDTVNRELLGLGERRTDDAGLRASGGD